MKLSFGILISLAAVILVTGLVSAQEEEVYRIKPADQLSIYVHENDDLTMTVTVLPDGTISYPLVGNLYVQGLTTSGLEDILTEKLGQFLQKPVVVITISSETLYKIYVMGELRMPNAYPFEEGRKLTDYLALAGGPTEEANLKKCYIFAEDSNVPRQVINLKEVFDDKDRSQNLLLKPNDTILLERRSGFIVSEWVEISQIFSIIVGVATIYIISENR